MNQAYKMERVLSEFAAMGANDVELISERARFNAEPESLDKWYAMLVEDDNVIRWQWQGSLYEKEEKKVGWFKRIFSRWF